MSSSQQARSLVFADLAGFTALTEAHGDQEAADLAGQFFAVIEGLLETHDARMVKTIGDAAMLCCLDAGGAIELGLRVIDEFGARPEFPSVRVGIHTGPAVERDGDFFGAAVNLAARISGDAAAGEVLLSQDTLDAAGGELSGVELESEGERRYRNVAEPVKVYRALRAGAMEEGLPIDPVCRMAVDPHREGGRLSHAGTVYHFCSLGCARAFANAPESYAGSQPAP